MSDRRQLRRPRSRSERAAERLDATLTRLGVEHDVREYPDASHSFLNRHDGWMGAIDRVAGIGLHEPSAEDAWGRIRAFPDAHLQQAAA